MGGGERGIGGKVATTNGEIILEPQSSSTNILYCLFTSCFIRGIERLLREGIVAIYISSNQLSGDLEIVLLYTNCYFSDIHPWILLYNM